MFRKSTGPSEFQTLTTAGKRGLTMRESQEGRIIPSAIRSFATKTPWLLSSSGFVGFAAGLIGCAFVGLAGPVSGHPIELKHVFSSRRSARTANPGWSFPSARAEGNRRAANGAGRNASTPSWLKLHMLDATNATARALLRGMAAALSKTGLSWQKRGSSVHVRAERHYAHHASSSASTSAS